MLLWKLLVEAAKAEKIDQDSGRARQWVRRHLPELLQHCTDEEGNRQVVERFDWSREWPIWRRNLLALLWLARAKGLQVRRDGRGPRIPKEVADVVDEIVDRTRNFVAADFLSEARIALHLTNRDSALAGFNVNRRFDDLETFWQCVFVSFFNPNALPIGSFCARCGRPLKPTRKSKKPTKAKLCGACRVHKWRSEHPEQAREMWRESK